MPDLSIQMDALYIDPDTVDIRTWLESRRLGDFAKCASSPYTTTIVLLVLELCSFRAYVACGCRLFEKHKVDFEILGDLTYEDIKEMGVAEVGSRRKVCYAMQ